MIARPQPHARRQRPIRVLIVDDSASVRATLESILSAHPEIEVMGTAPDPFVAAERIRQEIPDVMFLDIELPRMDGLTFLRKIMAQRPIPVVICSSLAAEGDTLMRALEAGAVEVVAKPRVDTAQYLRDSSMLICDAARAAAQSGLRGAARMQEARPQEARPQEARLQETRPQETRLAVEAKLTADAMIPPLSPRQFEALAARIPRTDPVVCLGASTGGTEALRDVLVALPGDAPAIVVVQHMPAGFTGAFARRLDAGCRIEVREAADGDAVLPGRALIAPGNCHMMLHRSGRAYQVRIAEGPFVCRHRPSVDVLFRSAAYAAGPNATGILMTGMGDDGAEGLLEMRRAGSMTIAQDEASSVVYGMPREAVERGAACKVMPLDRIAQGILAAARGGMAKGE